MNIFFFLINEFWRISQFHIVYQYRDAPTMRLTSSLFGFFLPFKSKNHNTKSIPPPFFISNSVIITLHEPGGRSDIKANKKTDENPVSIKGLFSHLFTKLSVMTATLSSDWVIRIH